jgi:hypothetical protein
MFMMGIISFGNNALLTPKFTPFKKRERIRRRMGKMDGGVLCFLDVDVPTMFIMHYQHVSKYLVCSPRQSQYHHTLLHLGLNLNL